MFAVIQRLISKMNLESFFAPCLLLRKGANSSTVKFSSVMTFFFSNLRIADYQEGAGELGWGGHPLS